MLRFLRIGNTVGQLQTMERIQERVAGETLTHTILQIGDMTIMIVEGTHTLHLIDPKINMTTTDKTIKIIPGEGMIIKDIVDAMILIAGIIEEIATMILEITVTIVIETGGTEVERELVTTTLMGEEGGLDLVNQAEGETETTPGIPTGVEIILAIQAGEETETTLAQEAGLEGVDTIVEEAAVLTQGRDIHQYREVSVVLHLVRELGIETDARLDTVEVGVEVIPGKADPLLHLDVDITARIVKLSSTLITVLVFQSKQQKWSMITNYFRNHSLGKYLVVQED